MLERQLELGDPNRHKLLVAGLAKYNALDRDTPEARFFIREDVKAQHRYAGEVYESQLRRLSPEATQLVLFDPTVEAMDDYLQVA